MTVVELAKQNHSWTPDVHTKVHASQSSPNVESQNATALPSTCMKCFHCARRSKQNSGYAKQGLLQVSKGSIEERVLRSSAERLHTNHAFLCQKTELYSLPECEGVCLQVIRNMWLLQ